MSELRFTAATADPSAIKLCCAAAYESDLVAALLGTSFHPGGRTLTRHLAHAMAITARDTVLDVASGTGTTAVLLADELGARVVGVDLSELNVTRAESAAETAGVAHLVSFRVGDAEALPCEDGAVDAVVSECALCTFPNKPTAVGEMARVLRPGGRVGITDVTVERGRLPPLLADLAGWIACVADAQSRDVYRDLFSRAGLAVEREERHDDAAAKMIRMIDARLVTLGVIHHPLVDGMDVAVMRDRLALARDAIRDGAIGYRLWVATKPERDDA